jgi:hypothetical protein
MDMRFGTWKIRSLNRAGSLMTIARELPRYRLVEEDEADGACSGNGEEEERL